MQEGPLLRQAVPMIKWTHSLLNLHLFEGCVDKGPSWLPTVSDHWLTDYVSKASQNLFTRSVLCSSLRITSDIASKWLQNIHNPQRQSWITQAPDTLTEAPNTLQMTMDLLHFPRLLLPLLQLRGKVPLSLRWATRITGIIPLEHSPKCDTS